MLTDKIVDALGAEVSRSIVDLDDLQAPSAEHPVAEARHIPWVQLA